MDYVFTYFKNETSNDQPANLQKKEVNEKPKKQKEPEKKEPIQKEPEQKEPEQKEETDKKVTTDKIVKVDLHKSNQNKQKNNNNNNTDKNNDQNNDKNNDQNNDKNNDNKKVIYYDDNEYFDLQILQLPVRKQKKRKIRLKRPIDKRLPNIDCGINMILCSQSKLQNSIVIANLHIY